MSVLTQNLHLFPETATDPPIARRRDPVTSKRAAVEHTESGRRENHKDMLFRLIADCPGKTCRELARLLIERQLIDPDIAVATTTKRTSDLIADLRIRTGVPRKCSISGRQARPYYVRG